MRTPLALPTPTPPVTPGAPDAGRRGGFTLLELVFAAFFLQIGLLAVASGFLSHTRATAETREADLEKQVARNVIEVLRSWDFDQLVADFGPGASDSFYCDADGVLSFGTATSGAVIKGSIELFDDVSTIPGEFADLAGFFGSGDAPDKLYAELGVLPVRLQITDGTDVTTVDVLLSRGEL